MRMAYCARYCRLLLIGTAILAARAAHAASTNPVIQVDTDEKTEAAHIRASIDIAAPPLVVWGVLIDCARATQIIPHLESCRILKSDPAGHWDVREHIINPSFLPRLRTVVRNTFEAGRRLLFKRVEGDMRISEGEWRIAPSAKGTRLSYDALVAPSFPVPQFVIEQAVQQDFPQMLRAIERASLANAAALASGR
jgi:carbon monoxide dehydrogenase subunit G